MPHLSGSRRCLLLVEDDRMVREMIVLMLEDAFDIIPAGSVATALGHLLATNRPPIDVILLDCVLPDGKIAQVLVEADQRSIPVILISGDLHQEALAGPARLFLAKPFSQEAILAVLDSTRR
jgi:DNA-binding response OmpR family regulator